MGGRQCVSVNVLGWFGRGEVGGGGMSVLVSVVCVCVWMIDRFDRARQWVCTYMCAVGRRPLIAWLIYTYIYTKTSPEPPPRTHTHIYIYLHTQPHPQTRLRARPQNLVLLVDVDRLEPAREEADGGHGVLDTRELRVAQLGAHQGAHLGFIFFGGGGNGRVDWWWWWWLGG